MGPSDWGEVGIRGVRLVTNLDGAVTAKDLRQSRGE